MALKEKIINPLPNGAKIDEYTITKALNSGGFSLVYLARDSDNERVVIKEYLPSKISDRGEDGQRALPKLETDREQFSFGLRLFLQEARTLSMLKHPNIVNVINFFRANDTAYMVMQFEEGVSLYDYIRRHDALMSERFIRTVFVPLLEGLRVVHSTGLLHLDIKPGNIYLRPGGSPLLLDFGAVHTMKRSRKMIPGQVLTPGYSPYEQSADGGYVGPWSDLYAIGATMCTCIVGKPPPPADKRYMKDLFTPLSERFARSYSTALLKTIDWALEVNPELRPQSVDDMLEAMGHGTGMPGEKDSMLRRLAGNLPWRRG